MRKKLIGFVIGLMLLTTVLTVAHPVHEKTIHTHTPSTASASSMVDVPVWEVNDSWTYQVNEIAVNITNEAQSIKMSLQIDELPLVVTDTIGEFYTLSFDTTMNGIGYINTDKGDGPVNVSINLNDLQISGHLLFEKSNLALKDFDISFTKQPFTITILEQPYFPLPSFLQKLTVKFTSNLDIDTDTSVTLLTFPLQTGMFWNLSAANLTANGKIESVLFKIIYFINNIAKLFGKDLLPTEIAALLPVIDIKDALTLVIGGNVFQVPNLPDAFFCFNTEYITVPAGTFLAFNITLLAGIGQCFFAENAGNFISIKGDFQDVIPFIKNIDMELLSTTYS